MPIRVLSVFKSTGMSHHARHRVVGSGAQTCIHSRRTRPRERKGEQNRFLVDVALLTCTSLVIIWSKRVGGNGIGLFY